MSDDRQPSLLETTLAGAIRDRQMATARGDAVRGLPPDINVRRLTTHADARGSVVELLDQRWNFHPDPMVFAYAFTIRPGVVKGWNLHKAHDDRYAILQGELELVMFDPRPDSPTCGKVLRVMLSERDRSLVSIPRNVWHADHNVGSTDALVVNFPTAPYDHANPDKYRLPIDTDLIPHSFGAATGW
jgi:dTDP-4-dehydrorhamnose 3,5-epimerase